jgi:hypothetical protein
MYRLELNIDGLPKTTNNSKSNWRARMAEARKWKQLVYSKIDATMRPNEVLKEAKLTLIRHSSVEPDFDGLVSSFKHLIDGLIQARVIENDKMGNIGQPNYKWEYVPRNRGRVTIIVEELGRAI